VLKTLNTTALLCRHYLTLLPVLLLHLQRRTGREWSYPEMSHLIGFDGES